MANAENHNTIHIQITENVTSDNAAIWQQRIEKIFNQEKELELDFNNVKMITSAGLRVLLSFQKRMTGGRKLRLINVSSTVMEVLQLTGFCDIIDVRRAARHISIDGCRLIGRGGTGECYQLDAETVVKLYYENTPDELIEREKLCAKTAFVAGIPTAISYDTVQVGKRKGIVYEMIKAKTLSQEIAAHPENTQELGKRYAQLAKCIHGTEGNAELFRPWTDDYRASIPQMDFLSNTAKTNALAFLDSIDDYSTYVHGDFNPNNIMLSDGELILIDMGEFSIGCPMFDLASLRLTFHYIRDYADDEIYPFTGLNGRTQRELWDSFIKEYFSVESYEEALEKSHEARLIDDVTLLKAMRCVLLFADGFTVEWCEKVKSDAEKRFA